MAGGAEASGVKSTAAAAIERSERRVKARIGTSTCKTTARTTREYSTGRDTLIKPGGLARAGGKLFSCQPACLKFRRRKCDEDVEPDSVRLVSGRIFGVFSAELSCQVW